jgi:holliday junction DNA helicase RuvA
MICRVTGVVSAADGQGVVLDQPSLGQARRVLTPAYLAERLSGQVGRTVTLHTMEYLEAHGQGTSFIPRLVGFGAPEDRRFFELFTSVKGLGNRRALRAMALPPGEIAAMVAAKDARGLQKLPEIGKRLAETVIAELSGKLDAFVDPGVVVETKGAGLAGGPASGLAAPSGAVEEAMAVLVELGQTPAEAERAIERALRGVDAASVTGEALVARVFGLGA